MSMWAPPLVGVQRRASGGRVVFEVDTSRALYKGIPWRTLGRFGKRKFENLIFIQNPKDRAIIRYL